MQVHGHTYIGTHMHPNINTHRHVHHRFWHMREREGGRRERCDHPLGMSFVVPWRMGQGRNIFSPSMQWLTTFHLPTDPSKSPEQSSLWWVPSRLRLVWSEV